MRQSTVPDATLEQKFEELSARFVAYRRGVLEDVLAKGIKSKGIHFQTEIKYLAHRNGAKIAEVPITFTERTALPEQNGKRVMEEILAPWKLAYSVEQ